MGYYNEVDAEGSFDDVVAATEDALAAEGFGVLCDIDVREKFVEKLDLTEYPNYRILGACNPPLAKEAIDEERRLGVLLPCNVVVYEDDAGVHVAAVDPATMLSVVDNPALDPVAEEVRARMDDVLDAIAA